MLLLLLQIGRNYHMGIAWPGHDGKVDILDEPSGCAGNLPPANSALGASC